MDPLVTETTSGETMGPGSSLAVRCVSHGHVTVPRWSTRGANSGITRGGRRVEAVRMGPGHGGHPVDGSGFSPRSSIYMFG